MGKDELAANLFRITQTDAKIKNTGLKGQARLEQTAHDVGKTVRDTMHKISGQRPEDLPKHQDIKEVKAGLKDTGAILKHAGNSDLKQVPMIEEDYLLAPEEAD